jgi:general secretion pathway protein J
MKKHHGFTLIELLVAITVLAIVAVLGWRGLDSIVRARVSLNSELERTRGLQLAFAQMQSDCDHVTAPADVGGRVTVVAETNRFTMVRTVFAENQPSRVQVVAYRVRDGMLLRRESVATRDLGELDAAWTAAMSDADTMSSVTLSKSVNDMAIRVWLAKGPWAQPTAALQQTGAQQSGTPANPGSNPVTAQTAATPSGLEVKLQLPDRSVPLIKIFLLGAA